MKTLTKPKSLAPRRPALGYAFLALLVTCVLASGIYFARKSGADPQTYSNDFNVYYYAAREVVAGRDPYQRSIGEWTPYLYPPLLAELLVPLALLPLPLAAYVWFVINAVSIGAAAWMSAVLATQAAARSDAWRAVLAVCALSVILRFVLDNFNLGQVNLVVAGFAVAHVYLYARNRKLLSAIALVLAVSIKLTPALLLVYHVAKLRLKFAAGCIALLAAVTLASFLPFGTSGVDAFRTFAHRTLNNEQGFDFAYSGNQSLRGAVARLTAHVDGQERRSTVDAVTLAISVVALFMAIFGSVMDQSELGAAAPLFCCLVLLSPLSWKAHLVVLILPAAYLLSRARASTGAQRLLIGSVLVVTFVIFNLTSPRVVGLAASEWSDEHSLVFVGSLLVFVASITAAFARKFGKASHVC
jgi:alpha-1,2-mannosyltransferase